MTASPEPLLAADEPPPCETFHSEGATPILLICDHASRCVPRRLRNLGVDERELSRYIGWDIGAADVARRPAGARRRAVPALPPRHR